MSSREAHAAGCGRAAGVGLAVLLEGGSSTDAAQRAVEVLEDDPMYNAGTGASLTADQTLELDACIMEGTSLRAGAVGALPPFKNPIRVARAVMEDGRHVFLVGDGAAAFARRAGIAPSTLDAMRTEAALDRWKRHRQGTVGEGWAGGTVGAVACDEQGRIAAATSTGGTIGKLRGRIGDSPILGGGTYADDETGGCSATGLGESIMRACLARSVVDQLRSGKSPQAAAHEALNVLGARTRVEGGLIVIDRHGVPAAVWNTRTMTHAIARANEAVVARCEEKTS